MVSTVTTSTITTITTTVGFGLALGVVAAVALLAFLCTRELAAASKNGKYRLLSKSLDVVIVPLLIAFGMIVAMKIAGVLT
mgnify:CR=1 FL=1